MIKLARCEGILGKLTRCEGILDKNGGEWACNASGAIQLKNVYAATHLCMAMVNSFLFKSASCTLTPIHMYTVSISIDTLTLKMGCCWTILKYENSTQ
jgi:hypothetical protein